MATRIAKRINATASSSDPFKRLTDAEIKQLRTEYTHVFGHGYRCRTDVMGHPTLNNRSPLDLRLHASEGFIPLWEPGTLLRWRFQEQSFVQFSDSNRAKAGVRDLMAKGLSAWGDAVPVKFSEKVDAWDFEVVMRDKDDCDNTGCVLASAFFPDSGRHELKLYPKLLEQTEKEQIETLAHEFGHAFGLRHFFAQLREKAWPSVGFGDESAFSIMNYGPQSDMTAADRADLRRLYEKVWSGELTQINGTPIRLVRPYHAVPRDYRAGGNVAYVPQPEAGYCLRCKDWARNQSSALDEFHQS